MFTGIRVFVTYPPEGNGALVGLGTSKDNSLIRGDAF